MDKIIKESDTGKGKVCLYKSGIMHQTYNKGITLLKEDSEREMKLYKNEFCRESARPIIVDLRDLKTVSKESRNIYSAPETARVTSAAALIVGNPVSRILGNFLVGINQPAMPLKMFNDIEQAYNWLKKYL